MIALAILSCVLLWIVFASIAPFFLTLSTAAICGAVLALLFWKG